MRCIAAESMVCIVMLGSVGAAGADQASAEFVKNEQAEIAEAVAMLYETMYFDADAGRKMASAVRKGFGDGRLGQESNRVAFARNLEALLLSIQEDAHINIRFQLAPTQLSGNAMAKKVLGGKKTKPAVRRRKAGRSEKRFESGFGGVQYLQGGIGYIDVNSFVKGEAEDRVREGAVRFVSAAPAVILDLRHNPGGAAQAAHRLIEAFLGAEPVHYATLHRREGGATKQWTSPAKDATRIEKTPLFILVDQASGSAAEAVAYHLKHLGRATIVGESTSGAGHLSREIDLEVWDDDTEKKVGTYKVMVPHTRAVNAVSGENWEGTGVQPDIACAADEALARAHVAAILAAYGKSRETDLLLELVEGTYNPPATAPEDLARLVGRYQGNREFVVDGNTLFTREGENPLMELAPLSATRFRYVSGFNIIVEFELDADGKVVAAEFQFPDGGVDRRARIDEP